MAAPADEHLLVVRQVSERTGPLDNCSGRKAKVRNWPGAVRHDTGLADRSAFEPAAQATTSFRARPTAASASLALPTNVRSGNGRTAATADYVDRSIMCRTNRGCSRKPHDERFSNRCYSARAAHNFRCTAAPQWAWSDAVCSRRSSGVRHDDDELSLNVTAIDLPAAWRTQNYVDHRRTESSCHQSPSRGEGSQLHIIERST